MKNILLAALLCCAAPLQAQIYSWQDSEGRTHYSDKPLDDRATEAVVDIDTMPPMRQLDAVAVAVFDDAFLPPLIDMPVYALDARERIATLYFGGDCVSPTRLREEELVRRYRHALPPPDDLQRALLAVWQRSFARGVDRRPPPNTSPTGGRESLYLQAEVLDMHIHACAPVVPRQLSSDALADFSLRSFRLSNVWVEVRWSLVSSASGTVLARAVTQGASENTTGGKRLIPEVVDGALRDAAARLLHQQALVAHFPRHQGQPSPAPVGETTWNDTVSVAEHKRLETNANLARVLTSLSALRIRLVEYYLYHDEWPVTLEDVDYHRQSLAATGLVSSLEMRYAGVIHVNLKHSVFPGNQILQMVPSYHPEMEQIQWQCRTTVESRLTACDEI